MQSFIISTKDEGQNLMAFLKRLLPQAPNGLLHKQLRNKNIVVNGKKCTGTEKLKSGDEIKVFMADDTIAKFKGGNQINLSEYKKAFDIIGKPFVIYEDENLCIVNKPVGVLSQKSTPSDVSINECLIYSYFSTDNEALSHAFETGFMPSVCNRLDRNTGGLITFGKTLKGTHFLNDIFRNRTVGKYYRTLVKGRIKDSSLLKGYLYKDEITNKVILKSEPFDKADYVETAYNPIRYSSKYDITELEVELITGKTHQIRAHLSSINHPIIGDAKYGDRTFNRIFKKDFNLNNQFLYAVRMEFPIDCSYETLAGCKISLDISDITDKYFC